MHIFDIRPTDEDNIETRIYRLKNNYISVERSIATSHQDFQHLCYNRSSAGRPVDVQMTVIPTFMCWFLLGEVLRIGAHQKWQKCAD